jgi:hypothetical protein
MNEWNIGGVAISTPKVDDARLMALLWGDTGSGKTTLAATAPGVKLHLCFDPGGYLSLAGRNDVALFNLAGELPTAMMTKFAQPDPYGIEAFVKQHDEVQTIIVDSMTTFAYKALVYVTTQRKGGAGSLDIPGIPGYSQRNTHVIRMVASLMTIADRHKRNLILITHEGTRDEETKRITMVLAKNTANQIGLRLNEIWHVTDDGSKRTIAVRPYLLREPMKTRMFDTRKASTFTWVYDPDTHTGGTIDGWLTKWQQGGGRKIPLP